MPEIDISLVETEAQIDAVRDLCRQWPEWLIETFSEKGPNIRNRFFSEAYRGILATLPEIHARPKGAMFLATFDGVPAGCVMYREKEPGQAEFHRLYVAGFARGHRLGERLMTAILAQMKADGYGQAFFNSARFLTHARRMYEGLGFREVPLPPEAMAHEYEMIKNL